MSMTLTRSSCRVELQERAAGGGRVDRGAGIIRDVKILGFEAPSKGRQYTRDAIRNAVPLYEAATVYIDHPTKRDPNGQRPMTDRFGELRDVYLADDGLRGDLHYIKSHVLAESVLEQVERFPRKMGLSHHANAITRRQGGKEIVESIERVKSVDLVLNPATSSSLFESTQERRPFRMPSGAVRSGRASQPESLHGRAGAAHRVGR